MADAGQPTFGKASIRSLETFGVAGFLAEKSKVFYCSIFTTRHVGRVTDLIAAKLLEEGLDELRLRALLLFSTFEVFRTQEGATEISGQQHLPEPLVIECGLDDDKVAIGISFTTGETRYPRFDGMVERVLAGNPDGVFEKLLLDVHARSHGTYVRRQDAIRRVEIVALLGIPGKADAASLAAEPELKLIEIPKEQKADPPKVDAYIELGDLDYPELLKESAAGGGIAAPATGEVLMHGLKEVDDAVKVRAADLLEALAVRVGSKEDLGNGMVRVKGRNEDVDDSAFKVTSGGAIQVNEGVQVFKGAPAEAQRDYEMRSYVVPAAPGAEPVSVVASAPAVGAPSGEGDSGNRLKDVIEKVKQAWPFRFGRKKEAPAEEQVAQPAAAAASPAPSAASEKAEGKTDDEKAEDAEAPGPAAAKPVVISTADIAKEVQKLTQEIESGIEKTITRAQGEAGEVKKEIGSARAKRWVDGLMSELVAEKARLAEASKALNTSIRQKEIEFRTKEQILTEELRRRDDVIRQKTNALSRLKDQLSQATMSAERLKSAKGGAGDDAHFKQKYNLTQKMLASAKEENATLASKIDDLKNQLLSAQNSKRAGPSPADFSALQAKYERSMRQTDDFKKANQQLVDKLNEAKKERIVGSQEDSKKRLEAAMKMAAGAQRDAEKLQQRVEEMQREQMRLQAELNKTTHELKSARVGKGVAARPATPAAPAQPAKPGAAKPMGVAGNKPVGAAATAAAAKPAAAQPATPAAAKPAASQGDGGKGNPPKAA